MKKCAVCKGIMEEMKSSTRQGVSYDYFKCKKCGEEILDMKQLHELSDKSR